MSKARIYWYSLNLIFFVEKMKIDLNSFEILRKAQFPHSFHTIKLGEITVFYAVLHNITTQRGLGLT